MKLLFSSRHFVVAILALLAVNACAYDSESDGDSGSDGIVIASKYDFESDGIYYNVSSEKDRTVEVTSGGYNNYRGNIVIPDGVFNDGRTYTVTSIGDYAFCHCDALTSVELPASLTSIENGIFTDCASLSVLTVDENNPVFTSRNNVLYSKNLDTLVCYPTGFGYGRGYSGHGTLRGLWWRFSRKGERCLLPAADAAGGASIAPLRHVFG